MNLRHLEHLLAVIDTGSFSRAAEQHHITQSALSRSIQALEDELGFTSARPPRQAQRTYPFRPRRRRACRRMLLAAELRRSAVVLTPGQHRRRHPRLGSAPGRWAMLMTSFQAIWRASTLALGSTSSPESATGCSSPSCVSVFRRACHRDAPYHPAPDPSSKPLIAMRTGFICRAGHPCFALGGEPASAALPFAALRHYLLASTPVS